MLTHGMGSTPPPPALLDSKGDLPEKHFWVSKGDLPEKRFWVSKGELPEKRLDSKGKLPDKTLGSVRASFLIKHLGQ